MCCVLVSRDEFYCPSIAYRSTDHVDPFRTMTNDIVETFAVLGIEAVRSNVEIELKNGAFHLAIHFEPSC
jgi:hypothetical protein